MERQLAHLLGLQSSVLQLVMLMSSHLLHQALVMLYHWVQLTLMFIQKHWKILPPFVPRMVLLFRLMFAEEAASQRRTNLEAAHGRIMDVDIASESTAFSSITLLVQASASMLAQANQSSNIALALLG